MFLRRESPLSAKDYANNFNVEGRIKNLESKRSGIIIDLQKNEDDFRKYGSIDEGLYLERYSSLKRLLDETRLEIENLTKEKDNGFDINLTEN